MNKKAKIATFAALLFAIAIVAIFVSAAPKQCNDGLDNDGDTLIDYPADPGCTSRNDNNEFNAPPNSCADSDGGFNTGTAGYVYGNNNGSPYIFNDTCITGVMLNERFCSSTLPTSANYNCTTSCVSGRCI